MENNPKELIIKHANIIFSELIDKGYGRNITIDVTDPNLYAQIEAWVKANNINNGEVKVKKYTSKKDGSVTLQYQLKLTDFTEVAGKDPSWGENNLGYGAVVNIVARAFSYDNKFGKGISSSISKIFIVEPAKNDGMAKIAE